MIPLSIINLQIFNFMRVEAVEFSPDGSPVIQITGRNAEGKSSVINAIWAALCWRSAAGSIPEPIRRGQETATVRIDLGDLIVTRTWKGVKSSLTVTTREGAKYPSPQSVLDKLVSEVGFDPLEFCRMQPKDQRTTLMDLLKIDFSQYDQERSDLLQKKGVASAQITGLNQQIGTLPEVLENTPDQEVSATDILKMLQEGQQVIYDNQRRIHEFKGICIDIDATKEKIHEFEREIQRLSEYINKRDEECYALNQSIESFQAPDIGNLQDQLTNIETINKQVRQKQQKNELLTKLQQAEAQVFEITEDINLIDQDRKDALASAKFPIPGLSFDETGILLNEVPFAQASTAEQIRVSLAMGIALNPDLRVLLIRDGNALDSSSMQIVENMARESGMQIFMERVDESGQVGIIIEDGMVRAPIEPGQQVLA